MVTRKRAARKTQANQSGATGGAFSPADGVETQPHPSEGVETVTHDSTNVNNSTQREA